MRAANESDPEGACSVSAMPDDPYVLLSDEKVQLSGLFKLVPVVVGIDRPGLQLLHHQLLLHWMKDKKWLTHTRYTW